jgi:hypothetical protein
MNPLRTYSTHLELPEKVILAGKTSVITGELFFCTTFEIRYWIFDIRIYSYFLGGPSHKTCSIIQRSPSRARRI